MNKEVFSNLNASCRKASELASAAMHRKLALSERFGMNAHLLICATCRQYRRQIRALHEWLRREGDAFDAEAALPSESLSDEARQRLREALRTES